MIISGQVYRHYKGTLYRVLYLAMHTETEEQLVVYRQADAPDGQVFCRPLAMFGDNVTTPGYQGPRFVLQVE